VVVGIDRALQEIGEHALGQGQGLSAAASVLFLF
jgi:hypothetical protein